MAWRCSGIGWPQGTRLAVLRWEGGRVSPLAVGRELGFRAEGERRCVGARGNPCPVGAAVSGRVTGPRCPDCARLDRAHSVAADTLADDPRTYRVYLAWFGPGMAKVGITAEERGPARLLEQGAVVFCWLGRGPLMAARRAEEVIGTALGIPERVPYAEKRAVRAELPGTAGERSAEVVELHRRARALDGWPETLEPLECAPVDHMDVFGLAGLPRATCVVTGLVDGGAVAGTLLAAVGPDLHLRTADAEIVVLDTRLMSGWSLVGAGPGAGLSVPTTALGTVSPGSHQEGLF
ncbi:DUF2797 domain-containing protein [Streptomyces clavuligerus]|uniref:DUF2797 domain-containing protein n=2 Tax=Streptomyces clavuligerus TaxID=1901 RepID=E2PVG7_STRCL|nr:DUF2797 domain-containing protein [Streptomyces clavuligerus]ANW19343.1 hypothetical protein BB341_14500 [Streptomyces clavuligerus]AXU13946.1 DUF2797 domain-containing protein [Streptomyces clavuligerus]EFG07881.1 Hypothetical protein SCLAV_2809 [Streptomyces clavuligerus]MBY6303916.1 DUF2797 domain-containing protein [Streptomyces clavuligerus]QCS06720.1 DUF2797 domain-containing protein [Streptomyces clavuligerus]